MSRMKSPSPLLIGGMLIAAFAVGSVFWSISSTRQALTPEIVTTGEADVGGSFSLVDQNGARRSDEDFRGRYMLVFFGFTFCPDICPTTLAILSAALDDIGPLKEEIVPILITVDPERDTPDVLGPYLSTFGSEFIGLTGTKEEIDNAVAAYRGYYEIVELDDDDYTVIHSTAIYLMDPDGKFVTNYALDMGPDGIAGDLRERIAASR